MSSRELILIATSNVNDMRMLYALLLAHDYEVITASDAKILRSHFKKHVPSIVIVDSDLIGTNVSDVCRLLKSEAYTSSVQFLAIVPLMDTQVHSRMLKAGADDLIFRPFSSDEIIIRVNASVERQHLSEESYKLERLLFSIASSFEARDPSKIGHPERIAKMSRRLGERTGLGQADLDALFKGGMLHDLGMLKIPKLIADKPGSLTSEEFEIMKTHTTMGERLCRPVRSLQAVLPILRHHHEQMDGKGYPDRLVGDQIPELARIVAICEIFDALLSDRAHRSRLPEKDAMKYMEEYSKRKWLDSVLVREFLSMVSEEGWPTVPPTSSTPPEHKIAE